MRDARAVGAASPWLPGGVRGGVAGEGGGIWGDRGGPEGFGEGDETPGERERRGEG